MVAIDEEMRKRVGVRSDGKGIQTGRNRSLMSVFRAGFVAKGKGVADFIVFPRHRTGSDRKSLVEKDSRGPRDHGMGADLTNKNDPSQFTMRIPDIEAKIKLGEGVIPGRSHTEEPGIEKAKCHETENRRALETVEFHTRRNIGCQGILSSRKGEEEQIYPIGLEER